MLQNLSDLSYSCINYFPVEKDSNGQTYGNIPFKAVYRILNLLYLKCNTDVFLIFRYNTKEIFNM